MPRRPSGLRAGDGRGRAGAGGGGRPRAAPAGCRLPRRGAELRRDRLLPPGAAPLLGADFGAAQQSYQVSPDSPRNRFPRAGWRCFT